MASGCACASGCGTAAVGKCVDLAFFDVQSEGGKETADVGEGGKVVVGDEREIEVLIASFYDRDFAGMVGSELRCKLNMSGNRGRFDAAEVFLVHATEKIVEDIGGDVGAEGTHRLLELFVERHRDRVLWLTGPSIPEWVESV